MKRNLREAAHTETGTCDNGAKGGGRPVRDVGGPSGGGWQESPKWVLAEAGCPSG